MAWALQRIFLSILWQFPRSEACLSDRFAQLLERGGSVALDGPKAGKYRLALARPRRLAWELNFG